MRNQVLMCVCIVCGHVCRYFAKENETQRVAAMKKKYNKCILISLFLTGIIFTMCACGGECVELFSPDIYENITEITYTDFQGNKTTYTDEESINIFAEALRDSKYILEDRGATGFYLFSFISNGKNYVLGYNGGNLLAYDLHQYKIKNNKFGKLLKLTK